MPKRKTPELDPKEQFKRFQETAKEHGVDEKSAERSFKDIASRSPSSRTAETGSRKKG